MAIAQSGPYTQPARERPGPLARLLDTLHPLYTLVDAARDPAILPLLRGGGCRHDSLFADERAVLLAEFAPYLAVNRPGSPLRGDLIDHWSEGWGIYLTSDAPYESLLSHLRDWLWADTEDGPMLFRFYDPRVLPAFCPRATRAAPRSSSAPFGHSLSRRPIRAGSFIAPGASTASRSSRID